MPSNRTPTVREQDAKTKRSDPRATTDLENCPTRLVRAIDTGWEGLARRFHSLKSVGCRVTLHSASHQLERLPETQC